MFRNAIGISLLALVALATTGRASLSAAEEARPETPLDAEGRQLFREVVGPALLTDLAQRGMLDETLVIWGGEFGRLPIAQVSEKPGRPGRTARRAAPKDGRSAASETREKPEVAAADAAAGIPGGRC